ncbi:MAG: Y-family DNA polymerase [Solirubrobacteraceae bacterium]
MVACVHLPRFELSVAAGGRATLERSTLAGRPLAVAPSNGLVRSSSARGGVGEVSAVAQARGIAAGMALSEALVRCPELELVPADPLGVAEAWEATLLALEAIGAAVESASPGLAYFEVDGLLRLHGGMRELLHAASLACATHPRAGSVRIGVGPTRFYALAAALAARPRRTRNVLRGGPASIRHWLGEQPLRLLSHHERVAELYVPLRRLGLRRLRELDALGADALADRFGEVGALAHRLVCGRETPLAPRRPPERIAESLQLDEADLGPALEHMLLVLVQRLLARRERDGRALRSATISARLSEGGTWRRTVVFRSATADGARICLALAPHLARLPAPAESLRLEVDGFGPPLSEQGQLPGVLCDGEELDSGAARIRRARLRQALDQVRAAAGPDAALRVVFVEPGSRVPERRAALAPFQG